MKDPQFRHDEITYRSMRWYEWITWSLLLLFATSVRGATIYRCDDGRGSVAFQDQPCSSGRKEEVVKVAPAPAYAPSPQYAVAPSMPADEQRKARVRANSNVGRRNAAASVPHAYECRSVDGQLFYRHSACPRSIAAKDDHLGHGRAAPKKVEVHSIRVSRDEACMQMHRAGASGRSGHANDEVVSSYERNLGHDPCR